MRHPRSQSMNAIASPDVHVVTITVTEKGYCQHPPLEPAILMAVTSASTTILQTRITGGSTLGVLGAGIARRPANAPLTVLCCDNIITTVLRCKDSCRNTPVELLRSLSRESRPKLHFPAAWSTSPRGHAASLSSVAPLDAGRRGDRVRTVPPNGSSKNHSGRPAGLGTIGRSAYNDVRPFQAMKLRLLNGVHSAIAYMAQLSGLPTVSEAMADLSSAPLPGG